MANNSFYDALAEEPIKMLDEFIESAAEGISSLFKDSSSLARLGDVGNLVTTPVVVVASSLVAAVALVVPGFAAVGRH